MYGLTVGDVTITCVLGDIANQPDIDAIVNRLSTPQTPSCVAAAVWPVSRQHGSHLEPSSPARKASGTWHWCVLYSSTVATCRSTFES
jgi:hypothetical protein